MTENAPHPTSHTYVRLLVAAIAAGALTFGGVTYAATHDTSSGSGGTAATTLPQRTTGDAASGTDPRGDTGTYGYGNGDGAYGFGNGDGTYGYDRGQNGDQSQATESTDATASQTRGVVDINTELSGGEEAAGTGMILTSSGTVLTNNHVVEGSVAIKVTVVSTGDTYTAEVVGTDKGDDVAVLRLEDASGLSTVATDTSDAAAVGDAVTGVGNAGGDGGSPSAAAGTVTAVDKTITTESEGLASGETLHGLIEVDANIQAGDSGGPLYDTDDEVIGMDTAASSGAMNVTGYAIPIGTALTIADRITSGDTSGGITLGYPAFLGVELGQSDGATIAGVVDGSGAADAGLSAGDTITSIGDTSVDSATAISNKIGTYEAGDQVKVAWTDRAGSSHSATVTLGEGPAA